MRITLRLDPEALHAAEAKAARERISLGKAVSQLIMLGMWSNASASAAVVVFHSEGGVYTSRDVEAAVHGE
jgi:hypothetical protein